MSKPYAALVITDKSRALLRNHFPPNYSEERLDHLTIEYGTDDPSILFFPDSVKVIAYANDGRGIEALLVEIDGQQFRTDGKPWHITISYAKGIEADKELDPSTPVPISGKEDQRKSLPYSSAMSNRLLLNAMNPKIDGAELLLLKEPFEITVTPQVLHSTPKSNVSMHPPRL